MPKAIGLMREAFVQISNRSATVPVRTALPASDGKGVVLYMPAYTPGYNLFGVKMVSAFADNAAKSLPVIQGKMLVMDGTTGSPKGLLDAEYLTSLRTGAASGLATELLANKESSVLAIYGTGAQAETQIEAILNVRPIKSILVFGTSAEKVNEFCRQLKSIHNVECMAGKPEQLNEADIICAATTSPVPLFKSSQLKPGVHINGIGSFKPDIREIPGDVIKNSLLIVDHRESALSEAGDILIPMKEGLITEDHIYAELGEIVNGTKKGRTSKEQITVFKSVGNAVQDLAMASFLLK